MGLNLSESLLAVICVVGGIYLWKQFTKRQKNLPPGPSLLVLLKSLTRVGSRPYLVFWEWAKRYGPIVYFRIGNMKQIVINDPKLMKEILSDSSSQGRMLDNPMIYELAKGCYGVLSSEGKTWEEQRPFAMRTLKNFGFSKTSSEDLILDEARAMIKFMKKFKGQPFCTDRIFNAPVVNSLWRMITGERFQWEEIKPEISIQSDKMFAAAVEITQNGLMFFPIIRHIAPDFFGWNRFLSGVNGMLDLAQKALEEHERTFQENNLRDYIDCFLLEMKKCKDTNSSFYGSEGYKNLNAEIFDFFLAGSETTANTSAWMLLYLSAYPNIQEKLYQEICEKVGTRTPSLLDRLQMPYTEAVILELFRIAPIVAIGVPRRMLEDKVYNGYLFPKGTAVFANIHGILHDPEIWGDPEEFRPERFLNEDGTKVVKNENLVNFGEGKRKCLGEFLARDTLFLFMISFVHEFKILPGYEGKPDFEAQGGIAYVPKPFKVIMSPR